MQRRNERELDRQMLQQAKRVFYTLYPTEDINDMRPKVASLKSHVRKNLKLNPSLDMDSIGHLVLKTF